MVQFRSVADLFSSTFDPPTDDKRSDEIRVFVSFFFLTFLILASQSGVESADKKINSANKKKTNSAAVHLCSQIFVTLLLLTNPLR